MPIPQMPGAGLSSLDDVINYVIRLERELRFLMESGLDSTNASEFGGWLVGLTELQSRDMKVGMSTESTGADDIRFWAGDLKTASPNFKVTEAGIASLVSALIQSATGYPRVEINSSTNLLAAYQSATNYLSISPNESGSPRLIFNNGTVTGYLYALAGTLLLNTTVGTGKIQINSGGDLDLLAASGSKVNFDSWSVIKRLSDGHTLQQDLDAKPNAGLTTSVNVITSVNFGASTTTSSSLNFTNGVLTSVT